MYGGRASDILIKSDRFQFRLSKVEQSADISSSRIHVKCIMQCIKIYHLFDGELAKSQKYIAEQVFTVYAHF